MTGPHVAIIGAGGVGATIAYALLVQGVAERISLFDINANKATAEVLDLNHGLQFVPATTVAGGDNLSIVDGADIIVITAGAKQRTGETRLDLASRNITIFSDLIPELARRSPQAVLLVVTNPVDVLTYVALELSGFPSSRVIGSGTVLDTSRLRFLLASRCDVAVSNVHATIAGEHGDSEFALWSSATIGLVPLTRWTDANGAVLNADDLTEIEDQVKGAAYKIIEGKGATTYAVGLAVSSIVDAIATDSHQLLPVSAAQPEARDLSDVCLSLPAVVGRTGLVRHVDIPMTNAERVRLRASADTIRSTIRSVGF